MGDEWSSPGELIHPGDLANITSMTSGGAKPAYSCGIRNGMRGCRDLAAYLSRRRTVRLGKGSTANRVAAEGCGASGTFPALAIRILWEHMTGRGASR
jgi:hypothetical protein